MNNITGLKKILIRYKWLILPGIPLVFFIIVMLFIVSPDNTEVFNPAVQPTIQVNSSPQINSRSDNIDGPGEDAEESIDSRIDILQKDRLPEGTIKYTLKSLDPNRPNIIIAKNDHEILFQRSVILPKLPIKITDYTESYGQVKWVFKGSEYYGPLVNTYIYPERGIAFIANPQTKNVFEYHLFEPLKVEEYVSKYGDDIPAQP
jgi:hypothetical protein